MSDEGCSSEEELCPDQSQQHKRTYDVSSSLAEEGEVSETDGSDKEDEDNSTKGAVERVSTRCESRDT